MYCCCVFVTYPIKIHKSSPFFLHRSHRWLMALANRTHIECFIIWSFKMVCAPSFCLFSHLLIAFDIFFFSHHLPCALFNSTTTHTYEYTARIKMYFIFIAETIFYEWFTWKCERFRMIFHFTRAPYVCTWMFACVKCSEHSILHGSYSSLSECSSTVFDGIEYYQYYSTLYIYIWKQLNLCIHLLLMIWAWALVMTPAKFWEKINHSFKFKTLFWWRKIIQT